MADRGMSPDHYFSRSPRSKAKTNRIITRLRGRRFEFVTSSSVFSKKRVDLGTRLLVESMTLPQAGLALDVGCGYGVVGIVAAALKPALRVFLCDINERAIRLTKQNVRANGINNAAVRRGQLYEPIRDLKFDCILSNPPISRGMETVKEIILKAPEHMTTGAHFQIVVKSKIGGKRFQSILQEAFGNVQILSRKSGYRVFISEKDKTAISH